ncbi:MAG: MoaD/ThiS family protein [Dehalococcoidales bacterium]|nr:MoaD/ThiS family protein [Dehalococcoidales bacterium]
MSKVVVTALSSVREKTGWSFRELDCQGATVADLLRLVPTKDGGTLFDLLIDGDQMQRGYVVFVNGQRVEAPDKLLQEGDKVVAMEVLRIVAGGQAVS